MPRPTIPSKRQKFIASLSVLIVITLLVVGATLTTDKKSSSMMSTPTATKEPAMSTTTASSGTYKDGTYKADGSYSSPGGQQTVSVSLTVAGGKVSDATVTGHADSGVAQFYQQSFIGHYKQSVVGKSLNDIHISRVAGSSLTSNGFNKALKKIEQEAKG